MFHRQGNDESTNQLVDRISAELGVGRSAWCAADGELGQFCANAAVAFLEQAIRQHDLLDHIYDAGVVGTERREEGIAAELTSALVLLVLAAMNE